MLNETNCTYMSAYTHPVASVYANVYADVHNICLTYTPAHAWCSTTLVNGFTLSAKNAYALVHARLYNWVTATLNPLALDEEPTSMPTAR